MIDCEWATLGHPVIDLAYTMTWYIFSMLEMKDGPAADWQAFKDKTRKALENMGMFSNINKTNLIIFITNSSVDLFLWFNHTVCELTNIYAHKLVSIFIIYGTFFTA